MKRLPLSLMALLVSSLAYAQDSGVAPDPLAGSGGDFFWLLYLIPVVVVAGAVWFFIKKGRATTRH